jgi:alpha-L-rhamnosidase
VDYLASHAKDGIVKLGLNDWAPWKTKTEAGITDTAYFFVDAQVIALAAQVLGKTEDAARYTALAATIKDGFNKKFYHADTGLYDNGSQTALSCALYQGLVPPEQHARVFANLITTVEKTGGHIDTGILGAKYLLNTLLDNGRAEVAYCIVAQKDQPGWGWWFSQGATTLWEQWDGSSSRNHIMFGDISAWFYKALAGIRPDPQAPGFKHFFINPQVVGDLTSASGDYASIRGRIVSDWRLKGDEFRLHVVIPPNTSATVTLPTADLSAARADGEPLAQAEGLSQARVEAGHVVCEAGSGAYDFRCPLAK